MNKFYIIYAISLLCFTPLQVHAACLPAELCAKATDFQDVDFGNYGFGGSDASTNYFVCAYVQNDDESNYDVTADGSGTGGSLIVTNGVTEVSMTIEYEEDSAPGWTTLSAGTPTSFANPDTVDEACGGGDTGKIRIFLPASQLMDATAGTYTGTVDITMSPD